MQERPLAARRRDQQPLADEIVSESLRKARGVRDAVLVTGRLQSRVPFTIRTQFRWNDG